MQSRLGLRGRLVGLVFAALLPLAVLTVVSALRSMDANVARTRAQLQLAASVMSASLDRNVEATRQLLAAVAAQPQLVRMPPESCHRYFAALRARSPTYANMGVFDTSGQTLCQAAGTQPPSAADRPYFQRVLRERQFVMGEAVVGRSTGRWAIPFAEPLFEGGELVGVLFATLDLEHAGAELARVALPEGGRMLVSDHRGRVLMQYPPEPGQPLGRLLGSDAAREAVAALRAGSGDALDRTGQERIFGLAPSKPVGSETLVSLVSVPRAAVVGTALGSLREQLALLAVTLVAGLVAAWVVGGRAILKPTKQILGMVRRLEQGNLEARVPLQDARELGEFARIAAAFNLMAESLQLRQQEVEAELGHSRSAYQVLDAVLNSMQEGLLVIDRGGVVLCNRAAGRVLPLDGDVPPLDQWPAAMGLWRADGTALCDAAELPFARGLLGETGVVRMLVRNPQVPHGRLIRCTYRPMERGGDDALRALVVFTDITELEKAEADLVLLRNAVARLNDIVLITEAEPLDAPGPRIVFVNEAFERLTGYSAAEAIGKTPRMLQGPGTDRAALDRVRAALAAGRPVREEMLNYTRDGREFWAELDIVPMADETGRFTHLISVQRDITARKAYERELQDFSAMLQRTAEAAQVITQHLGVQETLESAALRARDVIGVQHATVHLAGVGSATSHADTAPPGQQPLPLDALAVPLLARGGEPIGELRLEGKLRGRFNERDEYIAIELAQLTSTAIDNARLFNEVQQLNAGLEARIAERTAELSRQRELYRALAEQAPEVVWNVDPQGKATFFNQAWFELVGGQPQDWMGYGWLSRVHPDDVPETRAKWTRSRETLAPYTGTRRILGRDGEWHTTSYRAVPVLDEAGTVVFWVGIDSDITELKATELALRSSNQELEAFSYSVSHDLRAPLGAIGGFSKALAQRLEGQADDRSRHYLDRIQAGVARMEQLIEALLALSRVTRAPLTHEPVDLSTIAGDILENLQASDPQRLVAIDVQPGLTAHGDAALLRIVLDNLLGNAWKFTSRTSGPGIAVGRVGLDGPFFVRDNGVGFEMNYAGKLFSAFQRLHTEAEFPGTGIGLATVRRIITRHHGDVWVESAPGQGTTFFFTLAEGRRVVA